MKGTGSYSAIVSKLNPVRIASLSAKVAASAALPALIAANEVPQTPLPDFDTAKTEYIDQAYDKPIAVRVIDLSSSVLSKLPQPILKENDPVTTAKDSPQTYLSESVFSKLPQPILKDNVPVTVPVPDGLLKDEPEATLAPSVNEITTNSTEVFHETERTDKGIRMERFCDQIVIHIAEANGKGADEIVKIIDRRLMDFLDDYGA